MAKKKKTGPLRTELIAPVAAFVALVGIYMNVFFDSHMRSGAEWVMTYIHGAEVNIGEIETSFLSASLEVNSFQVTNPERPEYNIIQIHRLFFDLSGDALLRTKFVMEDSRVEGIGLSVKREEPGRVLPVEKSGKGALGAITSNVLSQAEKQYRGKTLGDLASIAGGASPESQMKEAKKDLKSEKKIQELKKRMEQREAYWQKKLEEYEKQKKIKKLKARAKKLDFGKNPLEALKEAKNLLDEGEEFVKASKNDYQKLQRDIRDFRQSSKKIDQWIDEDVNQLKSRASLPNLDANTFAMGLFGKLFGNKAASVVKYTEVAKEYMPPEKKEKADKTKSKKITPRKRGEGRSYQFPITTNYPTFWLKKMTISSKKESHSWSGDFSGKAANFTSHPAIVGQAATLDLEGNLPKKNIRGLKIGLTLDHVGPPFQQKLETSIAELPLKDMDLSSGPGLKLTMKEVVSRVDFSALHEWGHGRKGKYTIDLGQAIPSPTFQVESKNKRVRDIVSRSLAGLDKLTVSAQAKGPLEDLSWKVRSNIGPALTRGFEREVGKLIAKQEEKYRSFVENEVAPKKKEIQEKLNKFQQEYAEYFGDKRKEADSITNEIQNKEKEGSSKKAEDKAKEAIKGIKDKLGF